MQLSDYENKALSKLGESIHDGQWSNDGMVQLIELCGDYLNIASIQEFADRNGISYQAARKHQQTHTNEYRKVRAKLLRFTPM